MAIVEFSTINNRTIVGVCSNFFRSLTKGSSVYFCLKKGTLIFPAEISTPVLMIGPGTGIAPFMSFLEERFALDEDKGMNRFKNFVFFGCRNREKDFLHKGFLQNLQKSEK